MSEPNQFGAFERDTLHRMLVEAARFWAIGHWLDTHELPGTVSYFAYPDGPNGFDWGNPPGLAGDGIERPLRGRRVRITLEVEDV